MYSWIVLDDLAACKRRFHFLTTPVFVYQLCNAVTRPTYLGAFRF